MSLRLWLPFNGDTKDYSGNNIPVNATGVTYSNSGKIGKCIDRGVVTLGAKYTKEIFNKYYQSICFWHYNNTDTVQPSSSRLTGPGGLTGNGSRKYTLLSHPDTNTLHFTLRNDDPVNRGMDMSNIPQLPNLEWTHLCMVNNNGNLSIYINGVHVRSGIIPDDWIANFNYDYPLKLDTTIYMMNDFRIYDHALSEKEVKEIAKAKILHYTFENVIQPSKNLLLNPDGKSIVDPIPGNYKPGWDASLHKDAINVHGWGGYNSGVPSPEVGYHARWIYGGIDGRDDPCIYFQDENTQFGHPHRWLGVSHNPIYGSSLAALGLKVGDKLTLSFYQKSSVLNKGIRSGIHYINTSGSRTFGKTTIHEPVTVIDSWERVSITSTIEEDWDLSKDIIIYIYGYNGPEGKIWAGNIQLEIGGGVSDFITETVTKSVVRDQSGMGNDGDIQLGTTPVFIKNDKSGAGGNTIALFEGAQYVTLPKSTKIEDEMTINLWAYRDNWQDISSERMVSCTETGGWNLGFNDHPGMVNFSLYVNGSYYVPEISLENISDGWHMVTGTFDGYVAKLYIDSILVSTVDIGSGTRHPIKYHPTNTIFLGAEAGNNDHTPDGNTRWRGKLSDVSMYATALSYEDIMELYQNKLSIDSDGNVFARNLNEIYKTTDRVEQYPDEYYHFSVYSKAYPTDGSSISESSPNKNCAGLYDHNNIRIASYDRSWSISVWDTFTNNWGKDINYFGASSTGGIITRATYDIWNGATRDVQVKAFCNTLKNLTDRYIVIIAGSHAPEYHTTEMGEQIKRCGGTSTNLKWTDRKMYICIGKVGCGEGNAMSEVLDNMDPINNISSPDNLPRSWAHTKAIFPKYDLSLKENGILKTNVVEDSIGITDGLIGWWRLDGNTKDYSGNDNHGVVNGSPNIVSGINGLCYDLDGIDDFIKIPINISSNDSGTISLWHYPTHLYNYNRLWDTLQHPNEWECWIDDTGRVVGRIKIDTEIYSQPVISVDKWHNIVFVWEKGSSLKMYINGERSIATVLRPSSPWVGVDSGNVLNIGGANSGNTKGRGRMSDFRLYNRVLTEDEVSILYHTTSGKDDVKVHANGTIYLKGQISEV